MFCGQCGKRVLDTMLFCPFCGSPIVIPDQDERDGAPEAAPVVPIPEPEREPADAAALEPEALSEAVPEEGQLPDAPADAAGEAVSPSREADPGALDDFAPMAAPAPQPEFAPEAADAPQAKETAAPVRIDKPEKRPVSLFDDEEEAPGEPFVPLNLEKDAAERPLADEDEARGRGRAPARRPQPPRRPANPGAGRSNRSYIPVKDVDMNDMFMDTSHPAPEDEPDPYDEDGEFGGFDGDFDYEEPERGSFVQRHIRGLVGLALLAIVAVIFLIWMAMPRGQRVLATVNLAWSPGVYDDLGHEAYEAGQYRQAATYFEHALARDGDNYEYAHSAMVAYYEAENTDAALAMLKRCIEMDPASAEPYHELMILFPDAETRPWEVQELLRQGYQRTGDETLKEAAGE